MFVNKVRKVIHIDMDCFYAAVEMRENPALLDVPLAVGGTSKRGVLTTCNYVARRYGIRSAMPVFQARQLCPELIIVPVRFQLYRQVSAQIHQIFHRFTPLVEPLSLDEAYLDVSKRPETATALAREIREQIRTETGLTASAGIAPNKMLAKIASDWRKPDGQFTLPPPRIAAFMLDLPVGKVPGIGPKTLARLNEAGVRTCGDLQEWPITRLVGFFGVFGAEVFNLCRGEDERPVSPGRERKSISNEQTLSEPIQSLEACRLQLNAQLLDLQQSIKKRNLRNRVAKVFVKLKFSDFQKTTAEAINHTLDPAVCEQLLETAWGRHPKAVRLIGIGVRLAPPKSKTSVEQLEFSFPEVVSPR